MASAEVLQAAEMLRSGSRLDDEKALRKQRKKEKKRNREAAERSQAEASTTEPLQSAEQLKKQRKEAKRAAKASRTVPAAEANAKALRKKRKQGSRDQAGAQEADTSDLGAPAVDKQESNKKRKQTRAQAFAAVGDVELAKASKPICKDLYTEHADVQNMSGDAVAAFQAERDISVEGSAIKPVTSFSHLGFGAALLHAVQGFKVPSPVQAQCWPLVLSGHDLIGIAATGSGKTLAFGLPALQHILAQREAGVVTGKGPFVVCMAPTRELAQQICAVLEDAGKPCGLKAACIFGGMPKKLQAAALRSGVEMVVGTPGRMVDLMEDGTLNLSEVTYLVLDEADRMLDMGFEPEIRKIVSPIRADRQTLMFSATWPPSIQKLAMEFLVDPIKVLIGSQDLAASHSVTQRVEVIDEFARNDRLVDLLRKYHKSRSNRIIIFVLYKKEAPRVEQMLQRKGFKAASVHGDISQEARNAAVEQFKNGTVPLLIATDVAARGLDIPDVEVVINFSFPLTVEDYVHRIGRTGRAGNTGISHTFFVGKNDKGKAGELVNVLREAGQEVPKELMSFGTAVKKKESKLYGAHFKDVDMTLKASKVTFESDDD